MKRIKILDTTMRDGEQSPGVAFDREDKIKILRMLAETGVDEAEVGTPVMGEEEMDTISSLVDLGLPIDIFTWNRATKKDIDSSLACNVKNLFISSPVSDLQIKNKLRKDRKWVLDNMRSNIAYAKDKGCYVACGLEDSTRADVEWLAYFIKELEKAGADRIRISDTVGICTPDIVYKLITRLKNETSLPLEMHAHNDFGMATANSIAAIQAGAEIIDTTITGIGERAGNTALEEIALALHVLEKQETGIHLEKLKKTALDFSEMIGNPVSRWRPVTGENMFTHESGIHVDGILKNPTNYEPYPPELTASVRKFVIGKHSGRKAVEHKFEEYGIRLSERELEDLSVEIREAALLKKDTLCDADLFKLYTKVTKTAEQNPTSISM